MEIIVFILIGLLIGLVINYSKTSKSFDDATKLIEKISNKQAYSEKIIDELNFPYGSLNFSEVPNLFDRLMNMPNNQQIGRYLFIKAFKINEHNILCITNCTYIALKVSKLGIKSDEKFVFLYNFLIKKNNQNSQYEFYSESFDNLNEKNLRTDFRMELINYWNK